RLPPVLSQFGWTTTSMSEHEPGQFAVFLPVPVLHAAVSPSPTCESLKPGLLAIGTLEFDRLKVAGEGRARNYTHTSSPGPTCHAVAGFEKLVNHEPPPLEPESGGVV